MRSPLLIADGDIATTHILARVIRDACGSVEIRYPETLFGTEVANRSVTVSRLCLPSYSWLPRYLERRGVEYRYFLDDNFWALTAEVDPHLADFFSHPDTIRTLDRFLRGAKSVVTMSRRLAAVVEARVVGTRTEYLNPAFDAGLARRLALELAPNRSDLGAVRIGYPTSRRPSVAPLLDAVVRSIVGQYGDRVTFEFVGWMPDSLAEVRGVGLFPHQPDYDRYLRLKVSRQWDIGIAPLLAGDFEACKTSLKYREYGGCGVAGVYSAVPPYVDDVRDGETGLLVDNDVDAWVAGLRRLIDSVSTRRTIAANALADVERKFSPRISAQRWRAISEA